MTTKLQFELTEYQTASLLSRPVGCNKCHVEIRHGAEHYKFAQPIHSCTKLEVVFFCGPCGDVLADVMGKLGFRKGKAAQKSS